MLIAVDMYFAYLAFSTCRVGMKVVMWGGACAKYSVNILRVLLNDPSAALGGVQWSFSCE